MLQSGIQISKGNVLSSLKAENKILYINNLLYEVPTLTLSLLY